MTENRTAAPAPDAALVDRYLDDLARMLAEAPPAERADALGSVREYVDDALAALERPATSDDVHAVLRRLGPPEDLTRDLVDRGIVSPAGPAAPSALDPTTAPTAGAAGHGEASDARPGDGAATAGLVLGVLAVLLPLLGDVLGIGAVVLARRARRLGTTHESRRVVGLVLGVVAVVIGVVAAFGLLATFSFSTDSGTEVGQTTGAALLVGPVAAR
jgi:hypothetical protein